MVLKATAEIKRITNCVFVRSPIICILYEMLSDILPKMKTKMKGLVAAVMSIYESINRLLFAYDPPYNH